MKLIKPQPSELYTPEIGDIVFPCAKWFTPILSGELKTIPFINLFAFHNSNPFAVLADLGIDATEFKEDCKYQCPYLGYTFFSALPRAILSNDIDKYKGKFIGRPAEIAFDHEWWRSQKADVFDIHRDEIPGLWMGSGYSIGTMINDGNGKVILVKIPIDNGDFVLCGVWEWYNK